MTATADPAAPGRRKRAGVEPARDRLAAPTGFEVRPAHRGRFSSVREYRPVRCRRKLGDEERLRRPVPGSGSPARGGPAQSGRSPAVANGAVRQRLLPDRGRRSSPPRRAADRPASAPDPIWLRHDSTATGRCGKRLAQGGSDAFGGCADLGFRSRQQAQRRQTLGQPVRVQVQTEHMLQRRKPTLVQAQERASSDWRSCDQSTLCDRRSVPPAGRPAACRRRR